MISIPKTAGTNEDKKLITIAFLFCIILIFIRSPRLFIDARFWAEEGTYYFKHAYENGILHLFYIYKKCGYYYLYVNIATFIASLVPIVAAPYITTYLAFAVQVLLIWIILYAPSCLYKSSYSRILAALFTVVGAAVISEVWLNSVNSQVFFGLIAVYLLFVDYGKLSKGKRIFLYCVMAMSCLSGVYAVIVAPFFVAKRILEQDNKKYNTVIAIIQSACLMVQMVITVVIKFTGSGNSRRSEKTFTGETIINTIKHQIIRPLLGYDAMKADNTMVIVVLVLVAVIIVGAVILSKEKVTVITLLGLFVYYAVFTSVTALGIAGGRYAVVPGSVLIALLIKCSEIFYERIKYNKIKSAAWIIVIIPLIFGCIDFQGNKNTYLTTAEHASWEAQIQYLQNKNQPIENKEIKIWPDNWTIILDEK